MSTTLAPTLRDNATFDILSFGEPLIEYNQRDPARPYEYLQGLGGDTSNFAVAAAKAGARVGLIGALGNDRHAALLRTLWSTLGIDHEHVIHRNDAPTGVYFVHHDARGHHFEFLRKGSAAALYTVNELPLTVIEASRIFHCSGISLGIATNACDAAFAAMSHARAKGNRVSFDTNLRLKLWPLTRARPIMQEALSHCDICLPSYDDVSQILGLTEPDAIVDACLAAGAQVVALKLGEKGALVANAHTRHRIAPFPCTPVDATGAGDTFGGVFVTALVCGETLETAGKRAACAAAMSTEHYGAVAGIPTAEAILLRMAVS